MSERPGDIGKKFFAEQDRLRGGPAPELCTPDYRAWLGGNPVMDRGAHEGFAHAFYAAFADLHHEVEDVLADHDKVAVRLTLHGTHSGPFFAIPATGRQIRVATNVILHLHHGRVRELFAVFDEAGMLRQLGVLG